jgi:hypothetical protein
LYRVADPGTAVGPPTATPPPLALGSSRSLSCAARSGSINSCPQIHHPKFLHYTPTPPEPLSGRRHLHLGRPGLVHSEQRCLVIQVQKIRRGLGQKPLLSPAVRRRRFLIALRLYASAITPGRHHHMDMHDVLKSYIQCYNAGLGLAHDTWHLPKPDRRDRPHSIGRSRTYPLLRP